MLSNHEMNRSVKHRIIKALAIAASAWMMLGAHQSRASVTFVDLVPDMRTNQFNVDFNVDIDGNGARDVWFVQTTGTTGLSAYSAPGIRIQSAAGGDPGTFYPKPISLGGEIGATPLVGANWVSAVPPGGHILSVTVLLGSIVIVGGLFPGQDAFMGVELTKPDGIHYGYIQVEVGEFSTLGIIKSYAWETTPGVPIIAGSVPEPGRSALLLLAGLIGTSRRRRALGSG